MYHHLHLFLFSIVSMGKHVLTIVHAPYVPFKDNDKIDICCDNKQLQTSVA